MRWQWFTGPAALAALVTLANAVKPVAVDDTAYLAYARHIAEHPLDPYGFTIFWYHVPEPAMGVLCPPVVPYWLALGIAIFGEHPPLLKLWLFPFVWLLAGSLRELLTRFARGTERTALPLLMLSPAVMPMVNLMLDIPAAALGLAALVVFSRACDRGSLRLALGAGLVCALAMQTKYTALLVPPLLVWYGITHRRRWLAAIAVGVGIVAFAAWELVLAAQYGESHFALHALSQATKPEDDESALAAYLRVKAAILPSLFAHLGCLAFGIGLFAGRALGIPNRALIAAAVLWSAGVTAIALVPYDQTILVPGKDGGAAKLVLGATVWRTAGTAVLLAAAAGAGMLLVRRRSPFTWRLAPDAWFVVGWMVIELGGYFVLTPFPAARRVIGPTLALGLLAARMVSRATRVHTNRRPPRWIVPFGAAVGVLIAGLDAYDATVEKTAAEAGAAVVRVVSPDERAWYGGHWGFQYYCEREGMRALVPGESRPRAGDFVVLPVFPDDRGFYRPDSVHMLKPPPPAFVDVIGVIVRDDALPAQTIPNFYGGSDPILGRNHPRLRVVVYRLTRDWPVPDQRR